MKQLKIVMILLTCMCFLGISGCKFKRGAEAFDAASTKASFDAPIEASNDAVRQTQEADIVKVKTKAYDVDAITNVFWGASKEDAKVYIPPSYIEFWVKYYNEDEETIFTYEKDGVQLDCGANSLSGMGYVSYDDNNNAISSRYSNIFSATGYLDEGIDYNMRRIFPQEDLDTCTKEEAIRFCEKYADALGYQNQDVTVFAMTLESIEQMINLYLPMKESMGAPDPNYKVITLEEEYQIQLKVEEAKANGQKEEEEKLTAQWEALSQLRNKIAYIPWEKKDEAMLLVYRPVLNGCIVDGAFQMLAIVYVPALNKIVSLQGDMPYTVAEKETHAIISEEDAIVTAMLEFGIAEEELFQIQSCELVYSVREIQSNETNPTLNPCWKIDYIRTDKSSNEYGSIKIDAVTGFVSQ